MTEYSWSEMLDEMQSMLAAMVTDAFASNLHPTNVGRVDGLLYAIREHPESSTPADELLDAAIAAHDLGEAGDDQCRCGLNPDCQSDASGVRRLADALFFFQTDDAEELEEMLREREREREAHARETLEDRVFGTLRRARREMSAREVAERVGGDATGQQVGAVLRRLQQEGRVEAIEYRSRSGFLTRHWIAAEWVADPEEDHEQGEMVIEVLRRLTEG